MSSKTLSRAALAATIIFASYVQTAAQEKVAWGDEFKMHKGSTDLSILQADASGIYLEESHEVKSYFGRPRRSTTLVKLTPQMTEQYRNDFDHELKGKQFDRLFFIKDKLFLFATDFVKRDNALYLYAAEIDKNSGSLKNDWQQVYAWEKVEKTEKIDYAIGLNEDSTKIILTGTYTDKAQNRYEIKMMDAGLRPVGKPFAITNEFDPKTFQVQDFVYTSAGNAILVGRIYEYIEGKKKKDKNLVFKNYNIRVYDPQGKMIKELATDIDGKYLVTGKVKQLKNELVLAAFYSNEKRKREINGMLVQRLDPATGNVLVSTKMDLNTSLISQVEDDDDDKKSKKKDDDDDDGLAANLLFRNFYTTPDNGLIVLAERFDDRIQTSTMYMSNGTPGGSYSTTTTETYTCGDMYMAKITLAGKIDWLHVLPKNQVESQVLGSSISSGGPFYAYSYFNPKNSHPFYAGFSSLAGIHTIHIFFNDNDKNADILQQGKKIKRLTNFGRSSCYEVNLDMVTGQYTRKALYSNRDIPTSMPRLGAVMSNTMYLTGKEDRTMGKSKIVVGKITCLDPAPGSGGGRLAVQ
jgi:hypothetical protein